MAHLLVIGSPSLDTIHVDGHTFHTVGGSGLYASMAAWRSGALVTLFGARPDEVPEEIAVFARKLEAWMGPVVPLDQIPRFEIAHDGAEAHYIHQSIHSETGIDPSALPADLSRYDAVHITAMGDPDSQMALLRTCQQRNANSISLGTGIVNTQTKPAQTRALVQASDIFFMNEEEACAVFGSLDEVSAKAGQLIYITRAEKGALVLLGEHRATIPGYPAQLVDPTGAGESFCGAALSYLTQGYHPVMTGMKAAFLAAREVEGISASFLLQDDPLPELPLDKRVQINHAQVRKVSEIIKDLPEADPFSFVGDYLPPVGDPQTLDYFFAVTLQQFSFWETRDGVYDHPLIATIDGVQCKGSEYLFRAYMRPLREDRAFFTPDHQAKLSLDELADIFRSDDGLVPMPALELHLEQANQYGADMLALGLTPQTIIEQVLASDKPLHSFLKILDHLRGYNEDPIRKKANLLALILSQRPERFFAFGEDETVAPVVDYHCMRSVLRIGLVEVLDEALREKFAGRQLVAPDEEWAVRFAAYQLLEKVVRLTNKTIGGVDWFFFNYMRSHCPEMTEPVCSQCVLDGICAKRKELFQPVIRTTYY